MQIDGYIQALRDDLGRIAAVGDDHTRHAAELLSMALESSLSRRLLEALGEAALELSAQLDDGRVEVRYAGSDPEFVFVHEESEEPAPAASADEALSARITLRLPEALKQRVEDAASREGVSVNTWIVQALVRNATGAARRTSSSSRRLSGYGRS
ncbi:MAG: toxin-antitoxin system HicB family antitoxin [Actinomycetota bacterium]